MNIRLSLATHRAGLSAATVALGSAPGSKRRKSPTVGHSRWSTSGVKTSLKPRGTSTRTKAAIGAAIALVATGCGDDASSEGDITLTFAWWGPEPRHELTQEVIDLYEEQNPHVTIDPSYREWGAYWDSLATQSSGGDMPDIIQMDTGYLRTYAEPGRLLELDGVDVSAHNEEVVANGVVDGSLFAVTIGINATVMAANVSLFEQAGIDLPDDTAWTWEDYGEVATELGEQLEGAHGAEGPFGIGSLEIWLRQQGKEIRAENGDELGFTEDDAERYFTEQLRLMNDGAYPSADLIAENQSSGHEQSLAGQGQAALSTWSSNELLAIEASSGDEFVPLRMPSPASGPNEPGMYYKSSMYLSGSSETDHPEEVRDFIDFFANSVEAGDIMKTERGVPPNTEVLEAVTPELEDLDAAIAELLQDIDDEVGEAPPLPPAGGADYGEIVYRYELEVFFERMTPGEAAAEMVTEMS